MHWLFSNPKSASQADTAKRATAQRGHGAGPTGCRPAADAAALGERRGWPASACCAALDALSTTADPRQPRASSSEAAVSSALLPTARFHGWWRFQEQTTPADPGSSQALAWKPGAEIRFESRALGWRRQVWRDVLGTDAGSRGALIITTNQQMPTSCAIR